MTQTANSEMESLRASMSGSLVEPDDGGYDEARSLWNGSNDRRPAVIARCSAATDVAAALRYAQTHGLEVAVRGGGHSASGVAACDDGLMVHLGDLNAVSVDPVAQVARCGGGATLAELDAATQEHGLAVTGGMVSHTGVGGLTLGGGYGWLTRKAGLSIDNLTSVEIVLADGRVVRAAEDEHPDLFWAVRGGGGNFGVVTEFEFRLHEVGPLVHMGLLFWGLDQCAEGLRVARDTCDALPRNAGGAIAGMNAPPAPFVPERYHFAPGVALILAGFGSAEEHAALLEPVRAAQPPSFEFVTPMPYTALQQMVNDSATWGARYYTKGIFLDELSDGAVSAIAEHLPRKTSPMSIMPIITMGGAYCDVADEDTALAAFRSARYNISIDAAAATAEALVPERAWATSMWDALRPFARDDGGYVNYMSEFEDGRVRAAYGAKYERLTHVKGEYDPGNVFHLNANIRPA